MTFYDSYGMVQYDYLSTLNVNYTYVDVDYHKKVTVDHINRNDKI